MRSTLTTALVSAAPVLARASYHSGKTGPWSGWAALIVVIVIPLAYLLLKYWKR